MHIVYFNIPIPHKNVFKTAPYWNLEEYNNDAYKWEYVFEDEYLVSIISSPLIIFDGVKITSGTKTLVLDHVILIYIPKILDEGTYRSTLRLANVCYEGTPLYGNVSKKKVHNPHRGFIKIISHEYSSNAGIASGNVVPYHSSKISLHKKKTFKDIGDEIANNVWRNAMSTFGEKVDHHFHLQTSTTNHIYVGLDKSSTNISDLGQVPK